MKTLVLDTNIVSYLIRGHTFAEAYRPHLEGNLLAISFMTVGELYEGAFRANWGQAKIRKLEDVIRSYVVVPFSLELCRRWGEIRWSRRAQPISSEDAWIAATALANDSELVTHNPKDFEAIPSLRVITAISTA